MNAPISDSDLPKGRHYCRFVCTRGHKKRTVTRMLWDPETRSGVLNLLPEWREEDGLVFKWRLRCPCGLDVVLTQDNLDRLARWADETSTHQIELARLAATVGREMRR